MIIVKETVEYTIENTGEASIVEVGIVIIYPWTNIGTVAPTAGSMSVGT